MPLHQSLSALAFLTLATLSVGQSLDTRFSGQTCPVGFERRIDWIECGGKDDNRPGLQCGTLDVPLDYEYPTDETKILRVPLIRVKRDASVTGERKAIIYNPGGPGSGGIESWADQEIIDLYNLSEGQYDLVTFDPRGIALSNPFVTNTGANTNYRCNNIISDRSYESPESINDAIQDVTTQGQNCAQDPIGEWGTLIGTAFVARDIMAIADVVNDDKKVRYYGTSYGTLLGATLAQMFPTKMDRVVLDGNINPIDYYYGLGDETVADADAAVANFFTQCARNTNNRCSLAASGGADSGKTLLDKWDDYLAALKDKGGDLKEWRTAKNTMNNFLRDGPGEDRWVKYSKTLADDMVKNGISITGPPTTIPSKRAQVAATDITAKTAEAAGKTNRLATVAVTCADYVNPNNLKPTENAFRQTLNAWINRSKYMFDQYVSTQLTCYGWQTPAKERYYPRSGKANTANPVLFVQTPYDPVTPDISAKGSMDTFAGAGIIRSTGAGHCSGSQPSTNLNDKIKAYFRDGKIPAQSVPDAPRVANAFDEGAGNANQQTDANPDLDPNQDGENALNRKRDAFRFPRHLLERAVEKRTLLRRDALLPIGCKPIISTTTSTSMSSTSSGQTTTSTGSVTTTTGSSTTSSESSTKSTSTSVSSTASSLSTTSSVSSIQTTSSSLASSTFSTSTNSGLTTQSTSTSSLSSTQKSSSISASTTLTSTGTTSPTSSSTSVSTSSSLLTTSSQNMSTNSGITASTTSTKLDTSSSTNSKTTQHSTLTTSTGSKSSSSESSTTTSSFSSPITTSSKTWTTETRSTSTTSKPTWVTGDEWLAWSSQSPSIDTIGGGWSIWQSASSTAKSADPTPAWGDWNTPSEYKTFTKTATTTLTVSKCAAQITGCKDLISTKTIEYTTVCPTITVYETYIVEICPTGLTSKPITVTATCTDGCTARPTGAPDGYTVTKVWCDKCYPIGFIDITTPVNVYKPSETGKPLDATAVSTWTDSNVTGSASKTPVASSSTWNGWSAAVTGSGSPVSTPASTWASSPSGVKTYTGGANKQVITSGMVLISLAMALIL